MNKVFSYLTRKQAVQPAFSSDSPTLTEQHHKKDCDINNIMAFYKKTGGLLPDTVSVPGKPFYGDFSGSADFYRAQQLLASAKESFAALPSDLRERFQNDPGKMLAFLEDEKNRSEAEKLGLITPSVCDQNVVVDNKTAAAVSPEGTEQ